VTFGEAMDSGDKATNKAMSAAYKYALMQTFAIPTEGDHDSENQTHEVARKLADKVVADLKASLNEARTLDDLRTRTQKALAMAHQCGDVDAHGDLKAYSIAISETLKKAA
jgi:hypothetical protein